MKQFFMFLLLIIAPDFLFSQNISVKFFRALPTDLDARETYPKKDQNGDKCAIIKIVTSETDFIWDGDMLGIISADKKTGEYWLYVPHGAKFLTIKHEKFGVLRDYAYPMPINEATVYVMELLTAVGEEIKTQQLIINTEPKNAKIFVDGKNEAIGYYKKMLNPDTYYYRVEAPFYHPDTGKIVIPADQGYSISISLKPNHGFAQIISFPKAGAKVLVDGAKTNLITPCITDKLISGEHTLTLSKPRFQPLTQKITIKDGQTQQVTFNMQGTMNYIKDFYETHIFSFSTGYHSTTFSNTYFKNNISNGNIKRGFGFATTLNINRFPIFYDLTYFFSQFSVKNIEPFDEFHRINHWGVELSAGYVPFSLGANVYPYFGVGYQFSKLNSSFSTNSGLEFVSANTSLPLVKAGVKIRIKRFMVFGEYKNGFDIIGSGYAFSQIYSGIGVVF